MTATILHSFAYALDYLREQLSDVTDAEFAALPAGIANHPAWVVGHLTVTCQMIGGVLGLEPWLSDDYVARYLTGSVPDPSAEPKATALARLADAQSRLKLAVERFPANRLAEPFPDPAYQDVFPTIGHALTQVLVGHTSFHVGQVSVWRKALGRLPMARGFE